MSITVADRRIIRNALAYKTAGSIKYRGISFAKYEEDPDGVAAINVWGDYLGHDGEAMHSHERVARIDVDCRFINYGPNFDSVSAFTSGWSPALVTAFDAVQAGDTVTLEWTIDNTNATLKEAGLVRDELRLHATRLLRAGGVRHLVFEVAVEINQADSPARMIRPHYTMASQ